MTEHCKAVGKRLRGAISYRYILYVVLFFYTIMPLWMVSVQQFCLIGAVILQCILFAVTWRDRDLRVLKPEHPVEYALYGIGGFGIIGILFYCFGIDIGYQEGYEIELSFLLFFLIYLTIKCRPEFERFYPNVILAGLMVLQIVYLIYALVWPEMSGMPGRFVRDKESVAACAMLGILIAGIRYAYCKKRQEMVLYAVSAAVSAAALAINRDILSLYLAAILLFTTVILITPKPEAMKRSLQVLSGYLFLICNMSLLTGYTKLIQIECGGYELAGSVVLELILCIFMCYVMDVWDKLPMGEPEKTTQMLQKLQKTLKWILNAVGMGMVGILITGEYLGQLPDGMIWQSIETDGSVLIQAVRAIGTSNALYVGVKAYGVIGLVMVLILWSVIIKRIQKRYKPVLPERILLKMAAMLILILLSIRMRGMTVYGIYMWLLSYAMVPGLKFRSRKKIYSKSGVENKNETIKEAKPE